MQLTGRENVLRALQKLEYYYKRLNTFQELAEHKYINHALSGCDRNVLKSLLIQGELTCCVCVHELWTLQFIIDRIASDFRVAFETLYMSGRATFFFSHKGSCTIPGVCEPTLIYAWQKSWFNFIIFLKVFFFWIKKKILLIMDMKFSTTFSQSIDKSWGAPNYLPLHQCGKAKKCSQFLGWLQRSHHYCILAFWGPFWKVLKWLLNRWAAIA